MRVLSFFKDKMSFSRVHKKKGLAFFHKKGLLPSLSECLKLSFPETRPEEIIETMDDSIQYFICKKNKVVAVLSLVPQGSNRKSECFKNMIYNVATHPDFRRMGYMKHIFDRLQKDVSEIHLEVFVHNKKALSFYKKLKFKIFDTCFIWWEAPSYMMKKKVCPNK